MNQDFTVQKKQHLFCLKKKFVQRKFVQFVQAENSPTTAPPPPINFLMVRPLRISAVSGTFLKGKKQFLDSQNLRNLSGDTFLKFLFAD